MGELGAPGVAPVKHLLVDLDGTLLGNKSFRLQLDFVGRAMKSLKSYGGMRKRIRALVGVHSALRSPSPGFTNDQRAIEVFSRLMEISQEEGKKLLKESINLIFPNLEKHFYPVPGAAEFLIWAKDRYPLTLATNPVWPVSIVELRLRWAGVDPALFKRITAVDQMHACKPEPMFYEEVLAQEKLRAEDCLLIGDDLKMDLPATRVGIRVYIVDSDPKKSRSRESKKTAASKVKTPLPLKRLKDSRAPAWTGSYALLRQALQATPSS